VEAVRAGLSRMFGHGVAVRIEVNVSFDLTPMNKFRRTMRTFSIER